MGQSSSVPAEYARLIFSNNSLRNSLLQCDALGLYYQLSTPMGGMGGLLRNEHTTTFTRWDPRRGVYVVIAEWRRKQIGSDSIRLYFAQPLISDGPVSWDGFIPVKQFFPRKNKFFRGVNFDRTFTTSYGERYVWKSRDFSLKLYKEGSSVPIAENVERSLFINKHNAYIRLAPGCENILDYLVVTCVIAERNRRDAKKQEKRVAPSAGGAGDGGGGGGE